MPTIASLKGREEKHGKKKKKKKKKKNSPKCPDRDVKMGRNPHHQRRKKPSTREGLYATDIAF